LGSLSAFVKGVCDVMRRSNCASALQYVPELTWILFLRILDAQEERERMAAEIQGRDFTPALVSPYRWQDWAAPYSDAPDHPLTSDGRAQGWKRRELFALGDGRLISFINKSLLPHLHRLDLLSDGTPNPSASRKQRILGRIMTAVERVRVDSETNLADILDRVHQNRPMRACSAPHQAVFRSSSPIRRSAAKSATMPNSASPFVQAPRRCCFFSRS
jgi:type I restriction enzyme M protein